ncbi:hypothetical protein HAP48_0042805 [Bradyrhizobium septentrionale]|uniref:Uncharacterized protein n=1 Tax=Bradyrhizobium septentrionale TaxID=1404411 RepID=A0A974A2S3_9BRAD|nr:hypothetical protein [Bradyrhizobium septentrionale]UGY15189.1 hypothetical protein HAP48_0042805 [Bradyrhizobium septentrionale]
MMTIAYDVTVRRIGYGGGDIRLHVFAASEQMAMDRAVDQAKRKSAMPPRHRRYAVFAAVACEVSLDQSRTRHAAPFAKTDRGFMRRAERQSKQIVRSACFA